MIDTTSAATTSHTPVAPALELGMQELEELEAPGWGDVVSWVSGVSAGGGATYYIGVATYAASVAAT